jgi:hypothetical protein
MVFRSDLGTNCNLGKPASHPCTMYNCTKSACSELEIHDESDLTSITQDRNLCDGTGTLGNGRAISMTLRTWTRIRVR